MAETLAVVSAEQFAGFTIRMDQRFDGMQQQFNGMQQQVDQRLDDMRQQVNQRFDGMQQQVDDSRQQVDQRFDLTHESINHRFEAADKRFDDLNRTMVDIRQTLVEMRTESHADMRQLRQWLVGLCAGFVIAIGVALLKGGI